MRVARAAVCVAVMLAASACGADGEVTTAPEPVVRCPSLDEQLETVYALVDDGQLAALAGALSGLERDLRSDMVVALLRMFAAFEPGTIAGLGDLADAADDNADLLLLLADVVDFIAADGPGAPYPDALRATATLLHNCDGPPTLRLVQTLLADDALVSALTGLLDVLDVQALVGGLTVDGTQGREAIRALARNLLVAAQRPDFDVEVLLDLMGLLFDLEAPPYDALAAALRELLGPGPTLTQLQGLLGCVQLSDPDLHLVDLLLDVLLDDGLDVIGALDGLVDTGGQGGDGGGLLPASLQGPLDQALDFFIDDAAARRVIADVATSILLADAIVSVMADLSALLRADLVGDLVATLSGLATRSCPAKEAAAAQDASP